MARFETRVTAAQIASSANSPWWSDDAFGAILRRQAAKHPDRQALYDRRRRVTYGQLDAMVDRIAAKLQAEGLGQGDVVTIQLPNWVEFAACFFAVERIGGIAIQISTDFRAREVEFILRFSDARAFICAERFRNFDYLPMIRQIRPGLPQLVRVFAVDSAAGDVVGLNGAIDGSENLPPLVPVAMHGDDVYRMAFTSGTTGNPKAVIHSHNTTLSACRIQQHDLGITEREVFLLYLPLGLNWGYLALLQTFLSGARAVLLDRFVAKDALELIQQERVSYIPTAPASIIAMLNEPALARYDLSSLRLVVSGGASCPVETIREYQVKLKGKFIELYGMLETGFHTYTRLSDDPIGVSGTVGPVTSGMQLRLIDEAGNEVPLGAEGEIVAKGPSVHLGYYNNPQANDELFTADGWFRSGDMGVLDERGYLRIVGRRKEIINRGGKKFHPREVEEILYTHPKVLHVAIVGVADARLGERNTLCVIPKAGQTVTLDEMLGMLQGEVATYKLPEALEIFAEFPFTPTGKLQRHELTKLVQKRH
ncbi:MAG: acyl--CoA ligase [Alphaproteobacteria bacterium]|nr:acyl--CoA ligase [Alphaproteobacteria bacterium]